MFKWLDEASGVLLRFAYDSMSVFLVFVMLAKSFNNHFDITGLFGYTAGLFILSIVVNRIIASLDDIQRAKYHYIGLIGIVISLLLGTQFDPEFSFSGQMIMGGYFVVVWMNGLKFITEKDNTHFFFKRFFRTTLFILFIMFSVGIGQIDWVIGTLHPYFLVYFLAVFMNLVSMNLKSAYQEEIVNVIQVSRRIIVFNVVSVVILSIAIAGLVVLFSNVNFGWLETVLRFVLMPILQLGTFFSNRLRNKAIRNQNENGESNAEVGDNIEKMREDLRDEFPVDTNSNWDQYIEWAFIIIVILGIVAFAYYMTKGIEKRRRNKQNFDNDEVRETLLTASYLKKHLEDQWAKVSAKIDSVLGRNKEVLPRLRDVYKRYLKYIAHKGISISDAMTPNEILAKDQFKRGDKKTAKELTALYNAYRYGGLQDEYIDDEVLDAFEHAIESKEM